MCRTAEPHNSTRSRVWPAALSRKARSTRQLGRCRDELEELVKNDQEGLLGGQLGEPVKCVVPVGVGAGSQVPELVRGGMVDLAGELRELATCGAPHRYGTPRTWLRRSAAAG